MDIYRTLGIYADTAFMGISLAVFETDGIDILSPLLFAQRAYPQEIKERLHHIYPQSTLFQKNQLSFDLTRFCIEQAQEFLSDKGMAVSSLNCIGFSGQVVAFNPARKSVFMLGDAQQIANTFHCTTVSHFMQSDMTAGGRGRPLFPVFVDVLTKGMPRPLAFISLSGITSATLLGTEGQLFATDISCGQILMDKWMRQHFGEDMDFSGTMASKGTIHPRIVKKMLACPCLAQCPAYRFTHQAFDNVLDLCKHLSPVDGIATLTRWHIENILGTQKLYPQPPKLTILSGGGVFNSALVLPLKKELSGEVQTVQEANINGDEVEPGAYAFMAVRALKGFPISFPTTTGVSQAMTGGTVFYPQNA